MIQFTVKAKQDTKCALQKQVTDEHLQYDHNLSARAKIVPVHNFT